jgi:hypothetical protein
MVLTVSFVLSPATNSFLSPSLNGLPATCPGWAGFASAQLDISNGCQDHTTSPSAATSAKRFDRPCAPAEVLAKALKRRSSCAPVHRSQVKPALRPPIAPDAAASTASPPAFRDDRDTPLVPGKDGGASRIDLGKQESEIFFAGGLDSFW